MSIPTPKLSSIFLGSLLSVGLIACSEKDEDDGGDDSGETDTDTDTDTDTSTGTDTTGTGTGGGEDTGLLIGGYAGEATIAGSYDGYEIAYYIGLTSDNINCLVSSEMTGSDLGGLASCPECEFAFSVSTSGSAFSDSTGCDLLGLTDASGYDGATYGYGYQGDYYYYDYGPYQVLKYYYGGTWYAIGSAYAAFDGTNFSYDWPTGYYYYYMP